MGNDDKRVGRTVVVLEVSNGHPKEPGAQGLETLVLLGDGERRADLARPLEEANEMLDLSGLFLVMLEVGFNLLDLLESALEGLNVLITRLCWPVVGSRRWRSSWECAAFSNEVTKLRLVLPRIHGVNNLCVTMSC